MSLSAYKKKRTFNKTPEPGGAASSKMKASALIFVIQKHDASRLHYDFRLEMEGVLKSWAIPKGPSMNPDDRRLAMQVEDHPFDYKDFEGIIPAGNYGAGTVIVWDKGTYEPMENDGSDQNPEKILLKQLREGSLKISLKGKKIKGDFALVKTSGMEQNAWLLIKKKDKFSGSFEITEKERSVVSGKTIDQMSRSRTAKQWQSNRGSSSPTPKKKTAKKRAVSAEIEKKAAPKKKAAA